MSSSLLRCEQCKQPAPRLYQIPGGPFVCILCVPDTAFLGYPNWKAQAPELRRELETSRKRGVNARRIFGHDKAEVAR